MQFNQLKLGTKLAVMFAALIFMIVCVGITSIWGMRTINREWSNFEEVTNKKDSIVALNIEHLGNAVQAYKDYILRTKEYDKKFYKELDALDQGVDAYKKLGAISTVEDKQLTALSEAIQVYRATMPKLVSMKAENASITDIDTAVKGMDQPIHRALTALQKIGSDGIVNKGIEINSTISFSTWSVTVLTLVSIVAAIVMAYLFIHSLLNQLGGEPSYAAEAASRISSGDLTGDIMVTGDHTHSVLFAIKQMQANLINVVSDVRSSAMSVATGSTEIAHGNADLSSRTEAQAGSVEETASSVEDVSSTAEKSAEHAKHANQLSQAAASAATKGGSVVGEVVQTMHGINESSKKIADIISVIDGIAFQTNILALNAAVEAARAGEQGRGFAVVASEVRNLAQRSANAAKEIKILITDSVDRVTGGMRLVDEAGSTMDGLLTEIKHVTDIVSEIAESSREQSAGMNQINQAVTQMDHNTQQNAAMVEQMAAAAESLQEQAQHLLDAVAVFKLPNEPARHQVIATAVPPVAPAKKVAVRVNAPQKQQKALPPKIATPAPQKKMAAERPASNQDWEEF
jgi:methyl-accepting chemotaxis protein